MSNRQQRRAAMKKGKRKGETYADVLSQKKMIQEAVERSVHDHSIAIEADIAYFMKMTQSGVMARSGADW